MSSRVGTFLLVPALLGLALAAVPSGAAPHATAKLRNCPLTVKEQQHLGGTYVTKLEVAHVTCARGKVVVRAFQDCREKHGKIKGRCPKSQSVLGYHCTEVRGAIATQFNSKVTCVFGSRRVRHYYFQRT